MSKKRCKLCGGFCKKSTDYGGDDINFPTGRPIWECLNCYLTWPRKVKMSEDKLLEYEKTLKSLIGFEDLMPVIVHLEYEEENNEI